MSRNGAKGSLIGEQGEREARGTEPDRANGNDAEPRCITKDLGHKPWVAIVHVEFSKSFIWYTSDTLKRVNQKSLGFKISCILILITH